MSNAAETRPSILLVSGESVDREFLERVAEVANVNLVVQKDPYKAVDRIRNEQFAAFFVDGSTQEKFKSFENVIQGSIGLFSDRIHANRVHWLSDSDLQKATYLFESPIFGSYVSRSYGNVEEAGTRYGHILRGILRERAFGIENLLSENVKIQKIQFLNTKQKLQAVEAVKNFLLQAKFKSRMAAVIANAVDELIMNAMFDAPVDQQGNQVYVATPRKSEMALEGKSEVNLMVGYDGAYVALTACDLWGSLDKIRLFSHISKRYIEEEYKVKSTVAGAGIGLATVFRSGGSFLFSSEKSKRTEVTVFFKRTDNFREFKDQFRFISTQFYT